MRLFQHKDVLTNRSFKKVKFIRNKYCLCKNSCEERSKGTVLIIHQYSIRTHTHTHTHVQSLSVQNSATLEHIEARHDLKSSASCEGAAVVPSESALVNQLSLF